MQNKTKLLVIAFFTGAISIAGCAHGPSQQQSDSNMSGTSGGSSASQSAGEVSQASGQASRTSDELTENSDKSGSGASVSAGGGGAAAGGAASGAVESSVKPEQMADSVVLNQ